MLAHIHYHSAWVKGFPPMPMKEHDLYRHSGHLVLCTQLCDYMSEVCNASTSVQALAVDEARVYWTDTNGVFYVELDSNCMVSVTLSTMATTQLLATCPGLQQLPDASVLAGAPSTRVWPCL